MEKRNRNILILSIIALIALFTGLSFAYFSARITGLESASTLSLTAGRMGIVYSEDDASVTVNNIYPRSEAWLTKQITLTGYNTTNLDMKYDLGINITSNTFKGGQLTFDLTGVGTNGTKIPNITNKSILKTSGFFKLGTGSFSQADGDTHVYTLKIYFKDNGKDQNMNQGAIFNAKVHVQEHGSQVARANQNHNGKHCYTNNYTEGVAPTNGLEYTNGAYSYKYNYYYGYDENNEAFGWISNNSQNGWGVKVTDPTSTSPITTEFCAYINEQPVTNMRYMFMESQATSINLSSFDTSNVTNMSGMFSNSAATTLDLSSFDTSNVTDMSYVFAGSAASSLDLSSFDTSNVTNMSGMFSGSYATSLDLSLFDTSNVTNMEEMFIQASATTLDLSSFDTSNVTDMSYMFAYGAATSIDLSSFDTTSVTSMSGMFANSAATTLDLSSFDTSNVTDMSGMFDNCQATSIDLSSFNTSNVADMSSMFSGSHANVLDLSSFDTSNVTNMSGMFMGSHANVLDLSSFDTSNVTDMSGMFYDCAARGTSYARTATDAGRFNSTLPLANGNPSDTAIESTDTDSETSNRLTFIVK